MSWKFSKSLWDVSNLETQSWDQCPWGCKVNIQEMYDVIHHQGSLQVYTLDRADVWNIVQCKAHMVGPVAGMPFDLFAKIMLLRKASVSLP